MFTKGQLIFAVLFFVVFVGITAYSYRKDLALHRKYYKGSLYILLGFVVFLLVLFGLKIAMKP
ncbi:MAG: hypothetical protein Q4G08_06815 [Capnocytophaga sp.]|nr:hypothetical protein [Capnocytophaga sp.]